MSGLTDINLSVNCPVGWVCRIHRTHFCWGVRLLKQVSLIWHKTIWWWGSWISLVRSRPVGWGCRIQQLHLCVEVRLLNACPGYDTKQSDSAVAVLLELWWMLSISSLPSLPGPLWTRVVAPDRVLSMGQIELNWIVWNIIILTFKQRGYAKLNCLKWNLFCLLSRTVFNIETVLTLNWIVWNRTVLTFNCV